MSLDDEGRLFVDDGLHDVTLSATLVVSSDILGLLEGRLIADSEVWDACIELYKQNKRIFPLYHISIKVQYYHLIVSYCFYLLRFWVIAILSCQHWDTLEGILRYLKGMKDSNIRFEKSRGLCFSQRRF